MHALTAVWAEINTTISELVNDLYGSLLSGGLFLLIAILLLALFLSFFLFEISQKKAYVNRVATPKAYHYLLIAGTALTAGLMLWRIINGSMSAWAVMAVVIAAAGIYGLIRFRVFGPIASVLFLWCAGWLFEYRGIFAMIADRNSIDQYSAAGKIAVYAASDMIVLRAIGLEIIIAAITVFTVRYYVQRRFLFESLRREYLDPLTRCPKCSSYAVSEEAECPFCKEKFSDIEYTVPNFEVLDKPHFEATDIADTFKDNAKGILKSLITIVVVFLIVFVPALFINVLGFLTSGSVNANNAYVDKLIELKNGALVNDEWLASYNDAAEALYNVNLRIYSVNPRRIKNDDLLVYINYSEATVAQINSMNNIGYAINRQSFDELDYLLSSFDNTIDQQNAALRTGWSDALAAYHDSNKLGKVPDMLVNGFRFYTSFLPLIAWAVIMIVISLVFLALGAVIAVRRGGMIVKPYSEPALAGDVSAQPNANNSYLKEVRLERLVGFTIGILIFAVIIIIGLTGKIVEPEADFDSLMTAVSVEDPNNIMMWLADVKTDPETAFTPVKREEAAAMITNQMESMGRLEELEAEELTDDYRIIYDSVTALAPDLYSALSSLQSSIEEGIIPDQSQWEACRAVEEQLMTLGARKLTVDTFVQLQDIF